MDQAKKKSEASMFVFFTSKWTRLKHLDEIEKCNTKFLSLTIVNT